MPSRYRPPWPAGAPVTAAPPAKRQVEKQSRKMLQHAIRHNARLHRRTAAVLHLHVLRADALATAIIPRRGNACIRFHTSPATLHCSGWASTTIAFFVWLHGRAATRWRNTRAPGLTRPLRANTLARTRALNHRRMADRRVFHAVSPLQPRAARADAGIRRWPVDQRRIALFPVWHTAASLQIQALRADAASIVWRRHHRRLAHIAFSNAGVTFLDHSGRAKALAGHHTANHWRYADCFALHAPAAGIKMQRRLANRRNRNAAPARNPGCSVRTSAGGCRVFHHGGEAAHTFLAPFQRCRRITFLPVVKHLINNNPADDTAADNSRYVNHRLLRVDLHTRVIVHRVAIKQV